ncbi:hypothetical protein [Winogradskyella aurantiaca]|uniref:hypothetical protein n=1 Tax=Winogradskyella aurantiaca TaxID=2219558 RepID=UPI000E1D24D9|nr:hypothetical protein [Winogradskyella aurantiaca]
MSIDALRLLVDFGFAVLIWAVQLVIYPSFQYYPKKELITWHRKYTIRVTYIVLPLMFTQLILSIWQLVALVNWYTLLSVLLIGILWILTFMLFVPLHRRIDMGQPEANTCIKLVRYNWVRTLLWSIVFLISLVYSL